MRRRIGAEPQPGSGRGRGDVVQDRAGFHDRRTSFRIYRTDPVQVPGKVQHDTVADRVSGDRGTATAAGDRNAELRGDVQRGGRLLDVPREGHHARHYAVVRRIGRVLGPAPGRVVNLAQPRAA